MAVAVIRVNFIFIKNWHTHSDGAEKVELQTRNPTDNDDLHKGLRWVCRPTEASVQPVSETTDRPLTVSQSTLYQQRALTAQSKVHFAEHGTLWTVGQTLQTDSVFVVSLYIKLSYAARIEAEGLSELRALLTRFVDFESMEMEMDSHGGLKVTIRQTEQKKKTTHPH